MMNGVQIYDKEGRPVCAICGKGFDRLINHVRQSHGVPGPEYREVFGFCKGTAFISKRSKEKVREQTLKNYARVIAGNLIRGGIESRFYKGHNKAKHTMTAERALLLARAREIQRRGRI